MASPAALRELALAPLLPPYRWVSSTIRRKAVFGLIVILLAVVALIGLNITRWAQAFIFDGLARQAASVSRFVALDIQSALERGGGDMREILRTMELICGDSAVIYARLIDPAGRNVASSCLRTELPEPYRPLPLAQLYEVVPGDARLVPYGGVLDVYRSIPVGTGGKEGNYFLLLGFDAAEARSVAARVAQVIAVSALAVFLIGLLVLTAAVNRLTVPIETLTQGIAEVGEGRYPGALPVMGSDEVSTLTIAFNRMVADLTRSGEEIGRYQKHLEEMVAERTTDLARANRILSQTNQSLEAANDKLRELDRLKSNFLGIATHELKTPVAVVGGYLEYLEAGELGELTGVQKDVLAAAHSSCDRMTTLISDMLDLTKIESGKLPMTSEPRPLREAVDRALAHLAPLIARKGVSVEVRAEGLETVVPYDLERIVQVLVNLAGNAVKFTPAGGSITLSGREVSEGGRPFAALSVADTGIGISREDLDRVFDEFAQVGPPGKEEGTGLGLAICRRIVTAHGGTIGAESAPGKGSVFTFTLPVG